MFVGDEAQRAAAERSMAVRSKTLGERLYTAIEPSQTFWPAEDYHQKYRLRRRRRTVAELHARYGPAWIDTTTAARLNALLGGYGTPDAAWLDPVHEMEPDVRQRVAKSVEARSP